MAVITLISDLGTKDYYLAALKASVLSRLPDCQLVDISHHIPPFDISKAAFVLRNVWHEFPEGSVHVISVDSNWEAQSPYTIVEQNGHFFIGADTGVFSLLFNGEPVEAVYTVKLDGDEDLSFPTKSILMPIATRLANGEKPEKMGERANGYKIRPSINPVVEPHNIRGMVIYVDSYGNVITNITQDLFREVVGDKEFTIVLRRGGIEVQRISRAYSEVPQGEIVALFTSEGYLEIAINRGVEGSGGGASDLLGLKEADIVRVEFD